LRLVKVMIVTQVLIATILVVTLLVVGFSSSIGANTAATTTDTTTP
jgi:hypothetical protein